MQSRARKNHTCIQVLYRACMHVPVINTAWEGGKPARWRPYPHREQRQTPAPRSLPFPFPDKPMHASPTTTHSPPPPLPQRKHPEALLTDGADDKPAWHWSHTHSTPCPTTSACPDLPPSPPDNTLLRHACTHQPKRAAGRWEVMERDGRPGLRVFKSAKHASVGAYIRAHKGKPQCRHLRACWYQQDPPVRGRDNVTGGRAPP